MSDSNWETTISHTHTEKEWLRFLSPDAVFPHQEQSFINETHKPADIRSLPHVLRPNSANNSIVADLHKHDFTTYAFSLRTGLRLPDRLPRNLAASPVTMSKGRDIASWVTQGRGEEARQDFACCNRARRPSFAF